MSIPAKQRWIIYVIALALTLVAVKWAGGQDRTDDGLAAAARPADEAVKPASMAAAEGVPELRLDLLGSRTSPAPAGDPFQTRSWEPPPAPVQASRRRAPPPQAPPLPFAYMGKLVEDMTTTVFLARQDRNYIVRAGDTVDGTYLVETVGEDALEFLYLPLKARQTLPLTAPAAPAPAPPAPQPQKRVLDVEDDD